jgi:hypothetical protein
MRWLCNIRIFARCQCHIHWIHHQIQDGSEILPVAVYLHLLWRSRFVILIPKITTYAKPDNNVLFRINSLVRPLRISLWRRLFTHPIMRSVVRYCFLRHKSNYQVQAKLSRLMDARYPRSGCVACSLSEREAIRRRQWKSGRCSPDGISASVSGSLGTNLSILCREISKGRFVPRTAIVRALWEVSFRFFIAKWGPHEASTELKVRKESYQCEWRMPDLSSGRKVHPSASRAEIQNLPFMAACLHSVHRSES